MRTVEKEVVIISNFLGPYFSTRSADRRACLITKLLTTHKSSSLVLTYV